MSTNPTVVFPEPKRVVVEDRPVPEAGPGQLLVRTRRTLISTGTELTILNGEFPRDSAWAAYGKFPFTPGYNTVGVVEKVGSGVEAGWVGRRVACAARHAAFVTTTPAAVRTIRDDVSDEDAVFFTIAEIVMNGVRRGQVCWGESAVVYGLGLLGQFAVRFCHLAGAALTVGVDVVPKRLDLLPKSPRIVGVNPQAGSLAEAVKGRTRGRMADVAFEVTGNPDLIPQEFKVLRKQGRLVLLSSPRHRTKEFDFHDLCNSPSFTIIGAHNGSHPEFETPYNPWTRKRHGELYFDMVACGELDVRPFVTHRAPGEKAPELYAMLLEDRSQAMGVVLEWNAEDR